MKDLLSVDEALIHLAEHPLVRQGEVVPLAEALDRRLAEDILARVSRPPVAVSAMDGYAVRLADVARAGARLSVIGEAPAGTPFDGQIQAGEAVRIFTGGEVPQGSDHIIIQEDSERDGDTLVCQLAYAQPAYVRPAGLDFSEGDRLLQADAVIGPAMLALAAAANHATLPVWRRPRIGILANGNELKPPGSALARGEIINSNPAALAAFVSEWGGEAVDLGIAADSTQSIRAHIEAADTIDLFLPVGGASVGDHDHMKTAFQQAGFSILFSKVAVRPGKPTWFARRGAQRVLGLPGNPASALVCAHLFLAPLLQQPWTERLIHAHLSEPLPANGPREHFMRASARIDGEGRISVRAAPDQDSSRLLPFRDHNALIRRLAHADALDVGEGVELLLIGPLTAR